jgi:hypothetical protein
MSAPDKTYTFRGANDLASRARTALSTLNSLMEEGRSGRDFDEAMSIFWITVLRRVRDFDQHENQSALFRTTLEAFIDAAEKLARNREYVREYEQWAAEDEEGRAIRTGALRAAARRWDE